MEKTGRRGENGTGECKENAQLENGGEKARRKGGCGQQASLWSLRLQF